MPQRLCLLFCLAALPAAAVDFGRIRPDEVSFFVQDLQSGKVLAEHRADVPLNPASTMKLVTAYAALRALGGGFRWQTEFKSAAPLRGNLLDGDLYWTGSGDPMFDIPDLLEMQAQLGDNGVRHIGGRLVFDRSLWPHTGSSYGFANDAEHAFTTAPDPQMLAYKVVRLTLRRGADGSLTAQTTPPLPEVPLYNRAVFTASPAPCPKPRRFLRGKYENGILSVQGSAPPSCAGKDIYVNMFGTQEFARRSFATYWRQGGGILADGAAAGKTPAAARTLARVQSRPLREVLAEMNKHSNNIIARTVFLTIGTAKPPPTKAGKTPPPPSAPSFCSRASPPHRWCWKTAPACRGANAFPPA
ncbi:D-alanyl-D-alanine carboxypeptidase/D-alanyl-D-alanine endopeptidase [Kingella potus]|uniref:D-alanyl-D-alanine carboxypeptidase/D-alanyl-D-alanine endopeptidase n=1 Tax=Kingella potus TaxID=265175 RepID=UPI0031409ABD